MATDDFTGIQKSRIEYTSGNIANLLEPLNHTGRNQDTEDYKHAIELLEQIAAAYGLRSPKALLDNEDFMKGNYADTNSGRYAHTILDKDRVGAVELVTLVGRLWEHDVGVAEPATGTKSEVEQTRRELGRVILAVLDRYGAISAATKHYRPSSLPGKSVPYKIVEVRNKGTLAEVVSQDFSPN